MTTEDMDINRQVRSVFARNWVNLQKINYGATHGTIYITGRITLLRETRGDSSEEVDRAGVGPKLLSHLEKEMLKIEAVRAVRWDIQGWQRMTGAWLHSGIG